MATIPDIKTNHNTVIRTKTVPGSINPDNQADLLDGLADEILERGVAFPNDTTALSALSGANYKYAMVPNKGTFEYLSSGTANGSTIYAAVGGGVWSLKVAIPDISTKQDTLVSGTNIKSLNGQSLLGSGNINLVLDDEIEEYANLAAFPGTGASDIYYVALDTNLLYRWSGSVYVVVGGGSGGSQTLDQVLETGNVTDDKIVFDVTLPTVGPSGAQVREWIRWEPLIKGDNAEEYDVDFAFRQSSVNFSFANPLNNTYDDIMIFGWNLNAGGGLEKSSVLPFANLAAFPVTGNYNTIYRADNTGLHYNWNGTAYILGSKRGRTGIGESWEARYNGYDDGDMLTEKHEIYVDNLGRQIRIGSYTINTSNNNVDFYHTVGRFQLYPPNTKANGGRIDVQYFYVQPGQIAISDLTGIARTGINSEYQVDYGGLKNLTLIYGTNMDFLRFQNYPIIDFGSAVLQNLSLGNVNAESITLKELVATTGNASITASNHYFTNGTQYNLFQLDAGQNSLNVYGNATSFKSYAWTQFNLISGTNFYIKDKLRIYTDTNASYVMGQSDLSTVIGYDPGNRVKNVFTKQITANSGAADPTVSELDQLGLTAWKNTTSGDIYLFINDGGVIKKLNVAFT
jgi:hypothetical protein